MRYYLILTFLGLFLAFSGMSQTQSGSAGMQPGVIRVKIKPHVFEKLDHTKLHSGKFGLASVDKHQSSLGVQSIRRLFRPAGKFEQAHRKFGLHLWYEITIDPSVSLAAVLSTYRGLEQFEAVEERSSFYAIEPINSTIPKVTPRSLTGPTNDPQFNSQWDFQNTGQTGGTPNADISLPEAWAIQTGNSNVIVAVIDGGIDVSHQDLTASMWVNEDEIDNNGIDDDDNGYIDDVHGYGFGDGTGHFSPHYHATHVAGTIAAATNNNIGVSGIAGGNGSGNGIRLMSCAVFGATGSGGFEDAMVYAADNGAIISQNSWGGGSRAIEAAIDYFIQRAGFDNSSENFHNNIQVGPMAGGLVTFAAGNSNTENPNNGYPASYPPVIAVAATDHFDGKSDFSNYGSWVDISAPGSDIFSTYPGDGYTWLSGTSMACPHVSGVAALVISQFGGPGVVPSQIRERLLTTTDNIEDTNPAFIGKLGAGRLNAYQALQSADGVPPEAITDLSTEDQKLTSVVLQWTAPGGSGANGQASSYDIRYATTPIDDNNFNNAAQVSGLPNPKSGGTLETFEVKGLQHSTHYYFAIVSSDLFGNKSDISNITEGTTLPPPVIEATPSSLADILVSGTTITDSIIVKNTGTSTLEFVVGGISLDSPEPTTMSQNKTLTLSQQVSDFIRDRKAIVKRQAQTSFAPSQNEKSLTNQPARPIADLLSAGRLFALDHALNNIVELDPSTGSVINSFAAPQTIAGGPEGLAYDGTFLYFITYPQVIYQLDVSSGNVISSIDVSVLENIDALAHSGRYLYALDYSFSVIYEIDVTQAIAVRTIPVDQFAITGGLSFGGSRKTLFVSDDAGNIHELNVTSGEIVNTLNMQESGTIYGLGYSEGLGLLFASNAVFNNVIAINPDNGNVEYTLENVLSAALASDEYGIRWLNPDYVESLEPGEEIRVPIKLNAAGLYAGDHLGTIEIKSNDPVNPLTEISVALHVTGEAEADVNLEPLDFGNQYISYTADSALILKNAGTDTLRISAISFTGSGFSSDETSADVTPGMLYKLAIHFDPSAETSYSGTVVLTTNDADEPSIEIPLSGNGIVAPAISVAPGNISDTLNVGELSVKTITIENTGGSDLYWSLVGGGEAPFSVNAVQVQSERMITNNTGQHIPSTTFSHTLMATVDPLSNTPLSLTCLVTDPTTSLIYGQENNGSSFYVFDPTSKVWSPLAGSPIVSTNNGGAAYLNGKIYTIYCSNDYIGVYDIASDSWTNISGPFRTGNITSDGVYLYVIKDHNLQRFDPVNQAWISLASSPVQFEKWGGLSVYGNLIYGHSGNGSKDFAMYNIDSDSWTILPSLPGGAVAGSSIDPVSGTYYAYGSYHGHNLYAYHFNTNSWTVSSTPFDVNDGGMVYVGMAGAQGIYMVAGEETTVFARLKTEVNWCSPDAYGGVVNAGEHVDINVRLDASGLYGGVHQRNISVVSNDPSMPLIEIPVALKVIGTPKIRVVPDSVDFGNTYINITSDTVVSITNIGTDTLHISSVSLTGVGFTSDAQPISLAPEESSQVTITFSPIIEGIHEGTLTISSDDVNDASMELPLSGTGIQGPVLLVLPDTVEQTVFFGGSISALLTIKNAGDDVLSWSVSSSHSNWLKVNNSSGYLNEGEVETSSILFNASGLTVGDHITSVVFNSNDPVHHSKTIAVILHVLNAPDINLTSSNVNFGIVAINAPNLAAFGIENVGTEDLYISGISGDSVFTVSDFAPFTLSPGDAKTITVEFKSHSFGEFSTNLIIDSDDPDEPELTIHAQSVVNAGPISANPASIHKILTVGRSDHQDIILKNESPSSLIYSLSVSYSDSSNTSPLWLSLDQPDGMLAASATATIHLTLNTGSLPVGVYHADIIISNDHPGYLVNYVPVQLEVLSRPQLDVDPPSLAFGEVYLSKQSQRFIKLMNVGDQSLVIDSITSDDINFEIEQPEIMIAPFGTDSVQVTFTPNANGPLDGKLSIFSNDPVEPVKVILLTGAGLVIPRLEVSPLSAEVELRNSDATDLTFTLHNISDSPLNWSLTGLPEYATTTADNGALNGNSTLDINVHIDGLKLVNSNNQFSLDFAFGDPDGEIISIPVVVTLIENLSPKMISEIADIQLHIDDAPLLINLAQNFQDPEGDALLYSYQSDNNDLGNYSILGSVFQFEPLAAGSAGVTVIAEDVLGAKTSTTFAIQVLAITAVDEQSSGGKLSNHPNPANGQTTFRYSLNQRGYVRLYITDLRGEILGDVVNEWQEPGHKESIYQSGKLTSGCYLYYLTVDGKFTGIGKMLKN